MFKALNIQNLEQAGEFPRFHADLTTQYSGGSPYPASLEPEIRLMVMILEDAVQGYQRYLSAQTDAGKREFRDARFVVVFIVFPTLLIRIETDCQSSNPKSV